MTGKVFCLGSQGSIRQGAQHETADLAARVFELSQTIRQQWLTADYNAKRRILEIICLNCRLDGATLVPERRKPSRPAGRRARF